MFSSVIVSILLLLFVYLLLGLITNQIVSYIQEFLSWRAIFLEEGILNMLGDVRLTRMFYEHPFIRSLRVANRKPSYIPPDVFSSAILDILMQNAMEFQNNSALGTVSDREKFGKLYGYFQNVRDTTSFSDLFLSILNASDGSIVKTQIKLEDHYNNMVEGLSSGYRRRTQFIVLIVAMVLATVLNVDTIALFNYSFANNGMSNIPIGWTLATTPVVVQDWVVKLNGLLFTALITAVLSPFWFNLQRIFSQITVVRRRSDVAAAIDVLKKTETQNVQEIAASQIELLDEYHKIVLEQSRRSFISALVAAIFGLGFFLGAVISILSSKEFNVAIISVLSGALVEVISGVNFYLYAKTTVQMAEFQSRLDMTQRFLLANSICENLEGDFKQKTRSQLVLKIVDPTIKSQAETTS